MKLTVASFFADRLNLNGDQANLLVLARRAAEYGHELEVVNATSTSQLVGVDLVFVGHGSLAAWRSISEELAKLNSALGESLVLAIGSGAEHVAKESGLAAQSDVHESRFMTHKFLWHGEEFNLVGYVNSASRGIDTTAVQNRILSMLHGPLLAKNPALADAILAMMLRKHGINLGEKSEALKLIDELAQKASQDASR